MKNTALKIVNSLLYLVSTMLLSSGLVLAYRLEGPKVRGARLLGLTRHSWEEGHFILALSTTALVLAHVYLNWGWIVKVATGGVKARLLGSLLVGIVIVALALLSPLSYPSMP